MPLLIGVPGARPANKPLPLRQMLTVKGGFSVRTIVESLMPKSKGVEITRAITQVHSDASAKLCVGEEIHVGGIANSEETLYLYFEGGSRHSRVQIVRRPSSHGGRGKLDTIH